MKQSPRIHWLYVIGGCFDKEQERLATISLYSHRTQPAFDVDLGAVGCRIKIGRLIKTRIDLGEAVRVHIYVIQAAVKADARCGTLRDANVDGSRASLHVEKRNAARGRGQVHTACSR